MPNPNGHGALKTPTTLFFPLVTQTLVPNPNGHGALKTLNHSFFPLVYPNPNAQSKWPWSSQNSNHSFLSTCVTLLSPALHYPILDFLHWSEWHRAPPLLTKGPVSLVVKETLL
jgi:hypothetical protein